MTRRLVAALAAVVVVAGCSPGDDATSQVEAWATNCMAIEVEEDWTAWWDQCASSHERELADQDRSGWLDSRDFTQAASRDWTEWEIEEVTIGETPAGLRSAELVLVDREQMETAYWFVGWDTELGRWSTDWFIPDPDDPWDPTRERWAEEGNLPTGVGE